MCKVVKTFKLLIFLPIVFLVFVSCSVDNSVGYRNIVSILGGVWEFEVEDNYTFDGNEIEIVGGKAKLKQVDQMHSGNDFERGTHVGTSLDTENNLTLLDSKSSDKLSIANILSGQTNNLVAYWRFDNNWDDEGPNQMHGTPVGTASLSPANYKVGTHSADFAGVDSRVTLGGDKPDFSSNEYTQLVWVYPKQTAVAFERVISNDPIDERMPLLSLASGTNIHVALGNGPGSGTQCAFNTTGDPLPLNQWSHVAVSFKKGLGFEVYINGNLYHSNSSCAANDLLSGYTYFLGNVDMTASYDELAIYNKRLTGEQIHQVYSLQSQKFTELSSSWAPYWDNIVGYWKMDGNWHDSSGKTNHATATGASISLDSDAKVGSHATAMTRSMTSNIELPNISLVDGYTVSLWLYATEVDPGNTAHDLFVQRVGGAPNTNRNLQLRLGSATNANAYAIQLVVDTPGDGFNTAAMPVNSIKLNQWHHIVAVFDANDTTQMKLYLDGALLGSGTMPSFSGFATAGLVTYIAGRADGLNAPAGKIDEVALWNIPLNESAVKLIYDRQKQRYAGHYESPVIDLGASGPWTNLDTATTLPFYKEIVGQSAERLSDYPSLIGNMSLGLVGLWDFNEASYSTVPGEVVDASGSGNHGVLTSGSLSLTSGILGNSAPFDGAVDQRLSVDPQAPLNFDLNTDHTYAMWIKVPANQNNTVQSYNRIFQQISTVGGNFVSMNVYNQTSGTAGQFNCTRYDGTNNPFVLSGTPINDGQWHHITCTRSNGLLSVYLDGVFLNSTVDTASGANPLDADLSIGGLSTNNDLTGSLDEFSVWTRALTISEILQLYRRGANRIKYQVKSCVDISCNCKEFKGANPTSDDCDGDGLTNSADPDSENTLASFIGPGGNGVTSYSELYNRNSVTFNCSNNTSDTNNDICVTDEITFSGQSKVTPTNFIFNDFPVSARPTNNRYFQYRVLMEAEDNSACGGEPCLPELTSIEVGPTGRYFSGTPSIVNKTNHPIDKALENLSASASSGCDLSYQLSNDGTTFYYWNGSSWVVGSSNSQAVSLDTLNDNIKSFTEQIGLGDFYFRSYLGNSNFGECEVDKIQIIKARR